MQTILHIGVEKTGTTSFQQWIAQERQQLAEYGWLVPTSLGKINHRKLSLIGYDPNRRDDGTIMRQLHSNTDLVSFQDLARLKLERELSQARTNGLSRLIISSELIHSRLKNKSEISRLLTFLIELDCRPITVVLFLRDPAELANSKYSTSVRFEDMTTAEPPHPNDPGYRQLCHHQASIEQWEDVLAHLPMTSLKVRLYPENNNGVVRSDILDIMNLAQVTFRSDASQLANQALSPLALELLRRLNKTIPRFIRTGEGLRLNPKRGNLVQWLERQKLGRKRYGMSKNRYQQYCDEFQGSNEWVRSNYFPEMKVLFECRLQEHEPSEVNLSPQELDGLAEALRDLWLNGGLSD